MNKLRTYAWLCAWLCCLTLADAAPDKEHKTANAAAMRDAPKAGRIADAAVAVKPVEASSAHMRSADVPPVQAALSKAGFTSNEVFVVSFTMDRIVADIKATGMVGVAFSKGEARAVEQKAPAMRRHDGAVTVAAFSYVPAWREDARLLFPEIEARRAASDSYFGSLERRVGDLCEADDYAAAGELVRRYVDEWDNVYKVKKEKASSGRGFRRGQP